MKIYKVGYLIGSLSSTSINRKLARALVKLAPPSLQFADILFKYLLILCDEFDADYPPVIPGGLINAIDWASRPWGTNAFAHKPSTVIGASPGAIGTAVAQQSLRSVLGFLNSPQMSAPEGYIQFTPGLIDDEGNVTVESTREFLRGYMQEFHDFIARVTAVLPPDS